MYSKIDNSKFFILLLGILIIGALVRVVGIKHGEPNMLFHPDVSKIVWVETLAYEGNTESIEGDGGDFRFKAYPYGHAIITGTILRYFDRLTGYDRPDIRWETPETRWYWAYLIRSFSAASYLLAVIALMLVCRRFLSYAGLAILGLLLVLEPYNSQYSHYGMNDVTMTAFLMFTWACIPGMMRKGWQAVIWSAVAGICLGEAFGVKYQAILGGIIVLPIFIIDLTNRDWRMLLLKCCAFGVTLLVGAWLTCPLLHTPVAFWHLFIPFMEWQSEIVQRDTSWLTGLGYNLILSIRMLGKSGHLILIAGGIWGGITLYRKSQIVALRQFIMSGLIFCGLMLIILMGFRTLPRSNDMLPLFPFLSGMLALFLGNKVVFSSMQWRRYIWASAGLLVVWFGISTTLDSIALSKPDSRELALQWCLDNVQPGQKIYREHYTLALNKDGVNEQLMAFATRGTQKGRILENNFDYTMLSSLAHERFFDPLSPYYSKKNTEYYNYLFKEYPVLAEFKERRLFFGNPHIRIIGPRQKSK